MSGQGILFLSTSCPGPLLSSLLANDMQFTLSSASLSTQVSLNLGTQLSNLKFQAEVSSESLYQRLFFPGLSKASVELRTGDLSTHRN